MFELKEKPKLYTKIEQKDGKIVTFISRWVSTRKKIVKFQQMIKLRYVHLNQSKHRIQ